MFFFSFAVWWEPAARCSTCVCCVRRVLQSLLLLHTQFFFSSLVPCITLISVHTAPHHHFVTRIIIIIIVHTYHLCEWRASCTFFFFFVSAFCIRVWVTFFIFCSNHLGGRQHGNRNTVFLRPAAHNTLARLIAFSTSVRHSRCRCSQCRTFDACKIAREKNVFNLNYNTMH